MFVSMVLQYVELTIAFRDETRHSESLWPGKGKMCDQLKMSPWGLRTTTTGKHNEQHSPIWTMCCVSMGMAAST